MAGAAEEISVDTKLFQDLELNQGRETLRFWEAGSPAVVVGALGSIGRLVDESACSRDRVPILRRSSGGGAVVVGPGCLSYSFIVSLEAHPELCSVSGSYCIILNRIVDALDVQGLRVCGFSDIAIGDRKISGNSQRRGRRALLHHGTILYDFDLPSMERYLTMPERQPPYRAMRDHAAFVQNVSLTRDAIKLRVAQVLSRELR